MRSLKLSKSNSSEPGFTLVEILVTIGIALMVMSLALGALIYGINGSRTARMANRRDFEIMKVYPQMRRQLLSIMKSETFSKSFIETNADSPNSDSLRFFSTISTTGRKTSIEAYYSIGKKENGKNVLLYSEYPIPRDMEKAQTNGDFAKEAPEVISEFITGMTVKCEDSTKTVKDPWNDSQIPNKIMVTLNYMEEGRENSYTFTVCPAINILSSGQ